MAIDYVNIKLIKANPNNPRLIKDEKFAKLVKSIKDFPQMLELRPIVVNDDMVVLGGNMRLKACKEAGLNEVPVIKASSLTPEQQKEFIIKDNVGFGEWDWEMIANQWDAEQVTDWGLDIPDFKIEAEAQEDDYEIPDEVQTDIVLGDLFEIGEHRLLCGDSTKRGDAERLMNGKFAEMLFTDPPYNVDYVGKTKDKLKIENDNIKDFQGFLNDAFLSANEFMTNGAVYYIAHPDIFAYEFIGAIRACNWKQARPPVVQWVKDSRQRAFLN